MTIFGGGMRSTAAQKDEKLLHWL